MKMPLTVRDATKPILLSVAILLVVISNQAAATEKFDYKLRDLDGVEYRASDSLGKWLIINFWATWCTPCLKEMPELEKFYQNNRETADLWGVTFEDTDIQSIRKYVAKLGVTYPILGYGQDPKTGFGLVTVLPTTFVINPEGKFHHKFEGPITAKDISNIIERGAEEKL